MIIGIVDILFALVDLFVNSGVPFFVIFRLLLYKIPAIMVLFFPMAVLFAVMLLLVRMAKDNEVTILRASGLNTARILAPLLFLCLVTSALSYITNEQIVPWANRVSDTLIRKSIRKRPPPSVVNNVFFKEEGNRFFYIRKVDQKNSLMHDVLIFQRTSNYPRIMTAKKATWDEKTWTMMDGNIQEFDEFGNLDFSTRFEQTQIHVERSVQSFYTKKKTAKEMDSEELKEKIETLDKGGVNTRELQVDYYMKQSVPVTCFIFGLIGSAFCLKFVRSGKDWWGVIMAIIMSVLVVGFFFFLTALCRSLGKKGTFTPLLGAWMPNILYGVPGFGMIFYECYYR